jgi:hypothetical protein
MGSLTPGATYIYERVNEVVYAREFGKTERQVVGYKYDPYMENLTIDYELETVWKDIIKESRTNSTLQEAVNRVKILYHLSKDNGEK